MLIVFFKKIKGKEWGDMQTKITEKQKKKKQPKKTPTQTHKVL